MQIALYQPDQAGNFGAIIRLCACFGVPLTVIEPCGFPLTHKALKRAALDYAVPVEIKRHQNWEEFYTSVSTNPHRRIVLLTTKGASSCTDFHYQKDDILLFGQESLGVPKHIHNTVHARIYIPLMANTRALNLAQSCAIALYDGLHKTNQLP